MSELLFNIRIYLKSNKEILIRDKPKEVAEKYLNEYKNTQLHFIEYESFNKLFTIQRDNIDCIAIEKNG